jgi:hypothetical protein
MYKNNLEGFHIIFKKLRHPQLLRTFPSLHGT